MEHQLSRLGDVERSPFKSCTDFGPINMTAFDTFLAALAKPTCIDGVLGDECIEYPPKEDVDYWATPQNAVVFGWMGVDGVHYAILKIDGQVREESPVIQIGPMDFEEPYSLLAPTFIDYLATACGFNRKTIEDLLANEQSGHSSPLLDFMRSRFTQSRFLSDGVDRDIAPCIAMIVPKPDGEQSHALEPAAGSDSNGESSPPAQ